MLSTTILGLFAMAVADHTQAENWVFSGILLVILLTAVYSLDPDHPQGRWWIGLGLSAAIAQVTTFFSLPPRLRIVLGFVVIIFFGLLTVRMMMQIARSKRVNLHVILGAISVYLLVGMSAGLVFIAVESFNPEALYFAYTGDPNLHDFFYYSFVTMSTLGYGDVTPKAPVAQFLAYTLSLVGQVYMTVLVAFLVGKFISKQ
jgi:voltage-gated potassium channel